MTDAIFPIWLSVPKFPKMLSKSAIEPLPEIGLRIARGITWEGIPIRWAIGWVKYEKISKAPEAFIILTAVIKPIKDGAMENVELIPSDAPLKKVSKTGTFLKNPIKITTLSTMGII